MERIIKFLNQDRGFGFIESKGKDFFFHASDFEDKDDFNKVRMGDSLEFEKGFDRDMKGKAINVKII